MALEGQIVEVRSTGNDLNGGMFCAWESGGTDYTQQDSPQKSGTDLTMHATTNTKVQPISAGVANADKGNMIQISAGTNWTPGLYEIKNQDGTYWTLDRSPCAAGEANTATYRMGGAFATIGNVGAFALWEGTVFIKGNQTITSASTNISGGCLSTSTGLTRFVGYSSTRTVETTDAKPVVTLDSGVANATILATNDARVIVINLAFNGAGQTASRGIFRHRVVYRCDFTNFTNSAVKVNAHTDVAPAIFCTATGCSAATAFSCSTLFCEAWGNTYTAYGACRHHIHSLAYGNTGASTDGFTVCDMMVGCVAVANGRDGIGEEWPYAAALINNICESNGRYGWWIQANGVLLNNAHYNNASGVYNATPLCTVGTIAVTAGSVFVDAANGNFALNNTASRGALLRAAGFPSTFPAGLTASYRDIGAAQHADPAGGGGPLVGPSALISG